MMLRIYTSIETRVIRITLMLAFITLFTTPGGSQTIINAERLIDGADSTIYSLLLSYNGTSGNSSTNRIDISPGIVFIRDRNDLMLFGGYSLLSDSGKKILNAGFAHLRHRYRISDRFRTFEFYQIQFNDVLLLKKREVIGAGLTYELVARDSLNINFSAGLMRENEILNTADLTPDEISETRYTRLSLINSFKWRFASNIRFNNIIYYQPYLNDFRDFRLLNDLNIIISVVEHIELVTSLTYRYDSQPPLSLGKVDSMVTIGVNVKF